MNIKTQANKQTEIVFTIEIEPSEYKTFLRQTAQKMSQNINIDGFRPGKAPYDVVKRTIGEGEIMKTASSDIISHSLAEAVKKEKIEFIGRPEIKIEKMSPNDNFVYQAIILTLPKVEIGDINSINIRRPDIKIEPEYIDQALKQLVRSRAKEILEPRPAQEKDLVKLDYNIYINNIPQEGGQQKDFDVYLGEKHMVPGFEQQIIGLKAGDKKEFEITFPHDYFQKNFANKKCLFKVNIKGVYKLDIPEINDDFARSVGKFKNLEDLKQKIKQNLKAERKENQEKKLENDMFDAIVKVSKFDPLPDKMIESETEAMISELEADLKMRGLDLKTWLGNIKKTEQQLKQDFKPQALRRVKSALIVRQIAKKENITVAEADIKDEIKKIAEIYKDNQDIKQRIESDEYYNYTANSLTTKKVVDWLKEKIIK